MIEEQPSNVHLLAHVVAGKCMMARTTCLDGKYLLYYSYLFQYLHLKLEGKNPLIAFLRAFLLPNKAYMLLLR